MNDFNSLVLGQVLNSISTFPERNAFVINKRAYTYNDFGKCISKIHSAICAKHYANSKVGLVINDDIETYASIFALWLEGCCYVPLHPNWPLDRCKDICVQIGMDLILDSSIDTTRYNTEIVISTNDLLYTIDNLTPKDNISDEELAYILFTSGSTGKPKGVQISRKNLAAFTNAFFTLYHITEQDRCLQCFDLSFDLSIMSYLVPLTKGASVYTVSSNGVKYIQIGGLIAIQRLTVALMAPSTIKYLKPYFEQIDCSSLRYSLFCGEALPLDVTEQWSKCASNAIIDNVYGPTEDTIWCSTYRFNRNGANKSYNGILSIGKPMQGCQMEVFTDDLQIADIDEMGELCLAGEQLSPGYINNPQKDKESFFIKDGTRWYHSGDLCYRDKDGDILYSGRMDHQAKIQGFRIEMGEIEFHAHEFLKDSNVVCLAYDKSDGLTEIAMYIESVERDVKELMAYMKTKMPQYMIPSKLFFVPSFPLNDNGKVDKNQLKSMINN